MKWEYNWVAEPTLRHLNDLGEKGWEMVTAVIDARVTYFYLKRELKSERPD